MSIWLKVKSNIKNNLIPGIIVVVPIVISIVVLRWLIDFFDNLTRPLLQNYIHIYIPGLGLVVSIIFIYLVGISTKNYLGRKIIQTGEKFVIRIPVAKTIYFAVKQIVETLTTRENKKAQRVVLIEYPRKGIYSIGLYNGTIHLPDSDKILGNVLIITSINPASGFTVLVPLDEIEFTDMPVDQAMKLIVSGGIVKPSKIKVIKSKVSGDYLGE
ncbi:MAG: DUF502 domain-containing protein [Calditrichota bacterium]|jgi:uncharacterized membrane protein